MICLFKKTKTHVLLIVFGFNLLLAYHDISWTLKNPSKLGSLCHSYFKDVIVAAGSPAWLRGSTWGATAKGPTPSTPWCYRRCPRCVMAIAILCTKSFSTSMQELKLGGNLWQFRNLMPEAGSCQICVFCGIGLPWLMIDGLHIDRIAHRFWKRQTTKHMCMI